MDSTASAQARPAASAWVVPLLALMILINYVDRGNLSTAAPLIKDELKFSGTEIGMLLSAFFWSYTPAQILAGWLSERINAYRTLAIGLALWAIATAATGFANGFVSLLVLRLLLGLGESAAFPCSSKLLAQYLPADKLGAANGLILTGLGLGPAFGTFFGGLLMNQFGWRDVFFLFGVASLVWLVPWRSATRHASNHADGQRDTDAPSYFAIMRRKEAWGSSLGHTCANYTLYFAITWLPLYLVKARGFSIEQMAELGGLIYIVYALSIYVFGWLSDRWIGAGASTSFVRKAGSMGGLAAVAAGLMIAAAGSGNLSIAGLFLAVTALGCAMPNFYALSQTLAGPRAAGKWMGFQNCVANTAGIAAPIITGVVVDWTGHFFWAFVVAGVVSLVGILGWGVLIREVAPLDWNTAKRAT